MNGRDTTAKGSEGLAGTAEQSANSGTHRVHDKIAIITVQQENETEARIASVQVTQSFKQVIMIGRAIAQEQNISWSRPQNLQTVGKLAPAADDLQARLSTKSTTQ
jgi:hypothetical protein